MKVVVVGAGLLGSATARHLQERGVSVELIGPDVAGSSGPSASVHASHHDQSRIVRPSGHTPEWTRVNQLSIDGLRTFDASVFRAVGAATGCVSKRPDTSALEEAYGASLGASVGPWHFDGDVLYEPMGGVLNPIRLAEAQRARLLAAGGTWTRAVVERGARGLWCRGRALDADAVVVAAGAYSAALLGRPDESRAKTESTWLAEVPVAWVEQYAESPGWIDDVVGSGWSNRYAVSPRLYPDGKAYVKIGMDLDTDEWPTVEAIHRWFETGREGTEAILRAALDDLWPGLGDRPGRQKRCIVSYCDGGVPNVREVEPGLWWVGPGNGYSAMASDGIGRMATAALLRETCPAHGRQR